MWLSERPSRTTAGWVWLRQVPPVNERVETLRDESVRKSKTNEGFKATSAPARPRGCLLPWAGRGRPTNLGCRQPTSALPRPTPTGPRPLLPTPAPPCPCTACWLQKIAVTHEVDAEQGSHAAEKVGGAGKWRAQPTSQWLGFREQRGEAWEWGGRLNEKKGLGKRVGDTRHPGPTHVTSFVFSCIRGQEGKRQNSRN